MWSVGVAAQGRGVSAKEFVKMCDSVTFDQSHETTRGKHVWTYYHLLHTITPAHNKQATSQHQRPHTNACPPNLLLLLINYLQTPMTSVDFIPSGSFTSW